MSHQSFSKKWIWAGIIIAVLITAGFLFYFNLKKAVELKNVTLDATLLTHDTVEVELNMEVNNPFFFNFDLKDLQYTVALGGEELLNDVVSINKRIDDSTSLNIPITMNYKKVFGKLKELQAQDSTWLNFNFFVRYDLPLLGTQQTAINNTKKIPVPVLMDVKIDKIKMKSFGFKNIDLDANMVVDNPSKKSAVMDNLVFDVKLNETTLLEGMHWQAVNIDAQEVSRFTIPIEVKTGAIAKEFFDKITKGDKINVYLNGSCILKIKDSNLDSIKVYFNTKGAMQL